MRPLIFHGYSDDTFGEYGRTNDDHDNCASGKPMRFRVADGSDSLIVVGWYADGPTAGWMVGVEPDVTTADDVEPKPLPDWTITIRRSVAGETPYSPSLLIDAPASATVTYILADGTVPAKSE